MAIQAEKFGIAANLAEAFSTPGKIRHPPTSISKVRVIVRLRPFLPQEISSRKGNPVSCVSLHGSGSSFDEVTLLLKDQETSRNECYKLDAFFGQDDDNVSEIFEREVRPFIPGIFKGFNATVFAYGATGSGKTYTMQGRYQLPGLMPLAMSNILSLSKRTGSTVAISHYEIYLDKCYDLLDSKEKEVLIWNDKEGHIHLQGLAQIEVGSMVQFREIFSSAIQRRKVAQTSLNDVSSRSHGVLGITISTPSNDSVGTVVTGKLNLIDLAGNEDNRKTLNEGIRLQESAKINQSLFALSNVIYALNNNKPRIPYRESKLTRILQDSLGGTSRALMVACLNPGEYQESVHTVSLAARSRHVSNFAHSAQKNAHSNMKVDMEAKLLAWLESKGKTKSSQKMRFCHSPFTGRTPSSVQSMRKFKTCPHSNETKAVREHDVLNLKQRSPCTAGRNLFHDGAYALHSKEAQSLAAEINEEEFTFPVYRDASEEISALIDESSYGEKEVKMNKCEDAINPSPVNRKMEAALESPHREALSPIDSNFRVLGTPLDKLTAKGSNLKNSLVQDYIEFLNTASREELIELKGIGQKMAEYIVELRETSPLKALGDLEKLGLSSKQVHNMFGKAARGLLDNLVHDNA